MQTNPTAEANQKSPTPKATTPKAEPKAPPPKPAVNFAGEVELAGIAFPMLAQNGATSVIIGRHWSAGFWASGICRRITLLPSGVVRLLLERGDSEYTRSDEFFYVFMSQAGLYMEMAPECYAPIKITEEERASWPTRRTGG